MLKRKILPWHYNTLVFFTLGFTVNSHFHLLAVLADVGLIALAHLVNIANSPENVSLRWKCSSEAVVLSSASIGCPQIK